MNRFFYVLLVFTLVSIGAQAQESTITDEDLKKYGIAIDSIEHMKTHLVEIISEMVKGNENISGSRYNELSKLADDEAKLAAAGATAGEIEFIKSVAVRKSEETAKINSTFQSLAKDYIGAKVYNVIRKALNEDEAVKKRYEALREATGS